MNGKPDGIVFVDRKTGETLNGHLMPDDEEAWKDICEALRPQIAALGSGQFFEMKVGREQARPGETVGRITERSVTIRPPQIHPVKRKRA